MVARLHVPAENWARQHVLGTASQVARQAVRSAAVTFGAMVTAVLVVKYA